MPTSLDKGTQQQRKPAVVLETDSNSVPMVFMAGHGERTMQLAGNDVMQTQTRSNDPGTETEQLAAGSEAAKGMVL